MKSGQSANKFGFKPKLNKIFGHGFLQKIDFVIHFMVLGPKTDMGMSHTPPHHVFQATKSATHEEPPLRKPGHVV
jgi:hypothetical protein